MPQTRVNVNVTVTIAINDYKVIDRYVKDEPIDGEVYEPPYPELKTEAAILEHFAYNAVENGIRYANELDGWADLDHDAAKFYVEVNKTFNGE